MTVDERIKTLEEKVAALETAVQAQQMAKTVMSELNKKIRENGKSPLLG